MAKFELATEVSELVIDRFSQKELQNELFNLYILLPSKDLKDILKMLKVEVLGYWSATTSKHINYCGEYYGKPILRKVK